MCSLAIGYHTCADLGDGQTDSPHTGVFQRQDSLAPGHGAVRKFLGHARDCSTPLSSP